MTDRYPGYNVLNKRHSPSWNDQTREVIDARLRIDPELHRFCNETEWKALCAVCAHIIPQPADRPVKVPIAAMIDEKLWSGKGDGYRDARLPKPGDAWRRGLAAIDAEAVLEADRPFCELTEDQQRALLVKIQQGNVSSRVWQEMSPALF